ncbi:hypothetical protein HAX54_000378, partial [Datura stramonium]|nr:hypothetical protein [Datura stramonium]
VMEEFLEFIDNQCLIDLPLTGANFTWPKQKIPHQNLHLDSWCPLIGRSWFHMCYKFHLMENMWLKAPDFVDRVNVWWNGDEVVGTPSF